MHYPNTDTSKVHTEDHCTAVARYPRERCQVCVVQELFTSTKRAIQNEISAVKLLISYDTEFSGPFQAVAGAFSGGVFDADEVKNGDFVVTNVNACVPFSTEFLAGYIISSKVGGSWVKSRNWVQEALSSQISPTLRNFARCLARLPPL